MCAPALGVVVESKRVECLVRHEAVAQVVVQLVVVRVRQLGHVAQRYRSVGMR